GRRLDVPGLVRGRTVEAVGVAVLGGEGVRACRGALTPECEVAAVIGHVDADGIDTRAARIVRAGPTYGEAGRVGGGGQGGNTAGRGRDVHDGAGVRAVGGGL